MADLEKLLAQYGGTIVPEQKPEPSNPLDALAAQFGGKVLPAVETPGGYGAGTFAKDMGKLTAAGAVPGVLGAPEAAESAAIQQSKSVFAAPSEALSYLSSPDKLANKFVTSLGFKPIFGEESAGLIPEQVLKKQEMVLDEVSAKGKAKWMKDLTNYGNKLGQNIRESASPEIQLAMANFVPTGSLSDLANGKFENFSFGAKPTMLGLAGQFANVFGSVAPGMLGTIVTKNPVYMEAFGFAQAGSEGVTNAREYIGSLNNDQLSKNSPYFQELLKAGYDTKTARLMVEEKAADTAAAAQGLVGVLGGNFTAKLVTGQFDKALINSVKNRALNVIARTSKGLAVGAAEEGLQEVAEGIASDLAIDRTVVKEIGADAFANLVLGAIGGGGPGGVRGALAKEEAAVPPPPPAAAPELTPLEAAATTPPGAPPGAPKRSATITEDDLSTAKDAKAPEFSTANMTPEDKKLWNEILLDSKKLTAEHLNNYDTISPERAAEIAQLIQINDAKMETLEAKAAASPAKKAPTSLSLPIIDEAGNDTNEKDQVNLDPKTLYIEDGEVYGVGESYDHHIDNILDAMPDSPAKEALRKAAEKLVADSNKPAEKITPTAEETLAKLKADQAAAEAAKSKRESLEENPLEKYIEDKKFGHTDRQVLKLSKEEGEKLLKESGFKLEDGYYVKGNEFVRYNSTLNGGTFLYEKASEKKQSPKIEELKSLLDEKDKSGTYQFFKTNKLNYTALPLNPIQQQRLRDYIDAGQAANKPVKIDTLAFDIKGEKNTTDYLLDPDGTFTREDKDADGLTKYLTFVTKDGGPEWVPNNKIKNLQPVKVDKNLAAAIIAKEKAFIEKAKQVAEIQAKAKEPKEVKKTQAEINRERQAEKKAAADKAKQPVDTSAVKDLIEGKIKKVLGWTIYKRKEDPDFWYVQSPENHAENKIGPGDDVSTNLDTARARIEQHINDAEYEARKAAEKPAEKKAEPTAPKKGTSLYAAMLLADAKKNGDIDPSYLQGLMYKEMSSNVKDYTAAIEKAIADTKAKKEEKAVKVEKPKEFPKETPVSKEYQIALNKSRKAYKAFESAQDGYRKRLINDEEFLAARKRYDESMAEYDIAYAKEQEKPEPKEVKVTPKKTAPVSSEEEQLIQDAVMFAKAANRTNLDEAKIRDTVENARIKEPATVIDKLKGSVENLKNQAKDNLIRLAAEDYREQVGGALSKDSELVNAIKGGALNIEGKEYAPAFYKAYNINPEKIKKPTVGNAVDAQVVKFDSGIFGGRNTNPEVYDEAAVKFLESPLTAKIPNKSQEKIDPAPLKDITPLPIEKKIAVKNKTYEDQKAALADITAAEDIRYYLKGVKLDKDKSRMMASDGHRGAIINNANFDGAPETTKGNDIVAKDNSIIEGQFPDMDRVMPKSHTGQAQTINTKELGDYARGIQKAWRYVDSKINPITIKYGQKEYYFNADYVIDMANVFAKMGYDKFQLSVNKNDMMYATSPDNKVQQVLMAMKNSFSPFVTYGEKAKKKVAKVEVKEEPKAGVVTDDEGEKLSFPLFVDMAAKGYKVLGFDNPRTYETKGGKKYRTIEKDGVRLALNPGEVVFADPKYPNRSPMLGYGESNQVTWHFIGVDQDQRKQGKATQAIKDLMEVVDKNGYTVYGEPAQLEKEGMTAQELSKFYSKFGFQPSEVSEKVIVREPKSKAVSKVQEKIEEVDQDKKAVANIRKDLVRFASGMSGLSDLISGSYWRSGHQNYGVGFDVGLLSKNAIDQMAHYVVNMDTQVFIDSGAFSHFRKQLKGKEVADLDFDKILAKYGDILYAIGQESENQGEKVDYPRPMLVMPDIVGDQKASLELIDHHKDWIASHIWSNLAQPIIPLQKGELTLSEAYDNVIKTLKSNKRDLDFNEKKIIFGIPSNAEAVSRYDLIEFLQTSKPARIHFLGAAADSKLNPLLQIVAHVSPETKVTADASKVRSAILNGVAKGKTRDEAIKDALYEAEDPMVLMARFGESDIIDVIATEINPDQIKLLTNQTSKLSTEEKAALEEHYGVKEGTDEFFKRVREDIITYTNKGADAVAKAIRDIIAKLQAGLLAVAVVFNPTYMSEPSAVAFPTKTVTTQVTAAVPDSVKGMSEGAKKAYSILYPALQQEMGQKNKYFTVVDKPTSKVYVFNPDGSLMTQSNVVLGKALGDVYVGQTQFKQNQITPAGLIKAKAEKGSATYDGKTVYTFGNVKEGWNAVFMHTVYLKESDAEARKRALATGEDTRLSHGCVNGPAELMAKIDNESMNESHVFIVPDNQTMVDDYIANNVSNEDLTRETVAPATKTTQVPEKPTKPKMVAREEQAVEPKTQAQINQERQQAKLAAARVSDEGTFYNNFDADFNKGDFEEGLLGVREEQIKWQSYLSRQLTATMKDVANYGSDLGIQAKLNYLREAKEEVKDLLNRSKEERRGVDWFVARAATAKAEKQLSAEAKAVVDTLAAKYPAILSGLKLSVVQSKKAGVAGNFRPFERLVTIYHSSLSPILNPKSAERQAVTMRHEIAHSLEQLMTPQAQVALVEAWGSSLAKAIEANPGEPEQKFFQAVLDFVENPTESNMKRATNLMPDINFYQYVNPSEFWAVNAEKLMKSQLGTPWARFVKAVQKLWESIKSVFGFDNRYAIHREFDRIMKGDQKQMTKMMLADYLKQNETEIKFLNNVEEDDELLEKYERPDAPLHYSPSVMDRLLGGKKIVKELARKVREKPMLPINNMVSTVGRGVLYTRVKNVYFGAALDEADRVKYEGKLRDSEGFVVSSIAVTNALHAGHVGTQVMLQGKLSFDPITQMFRAVQDKFSLANVVRIKNKLEKKVGAQRAANLIQAYFEAKRSRSIVNEYLERSKELDKLIQEQLDPITSDERQLKLMKEIAEAQEDLRNIQRAVDKVNMDDEQIDEFIALENKYSELRDMMDNWTSVNQNMIDMMEFSGIISKQRAETLRNIKDYVPWYRIQDDAKDVHSAQGVRSLTDVGREKSFKEGTTELEIDDIVDNMIHNVMMLTRNSMRNYAANRVALEYAERNDKGKLQVYPTEDREKGIFNILANGRRINVRITDPLIAESVMGLENIQIPMEGIMRFFANGLRWSVTINPVFQVKQLFMDAPTAALVTGVKHPFRLWGGVFGGFIRALKPHDPIVDLLKSYGIGGYRSSSRTPEHELKQEIGILNKNYFDKAIKFLDHISDASDYSQRVSIYKRVLKETVSDEFPQGDMMQALVQANNVIDFQKKGSGKTAQLLTRTVSFMNAYAQQIDVLAQALSGKGLKGMKRTEALVRLRNTGVLLAGVTLLYCYAVGDDDEYQKMDDQTKMRNFVIPKSLTKTIGMDHAILLPMSTSAAFFFKAVPEMLFNKIVNDGTKNEIDKTRLYSALGKAAVDSLLGPTPFPTGAKPFVEIGLDYNFFTGGTVTPKGMEKLDPSRQYTNTTSELGKIISKLSGGALNPIQADHVMRGLGGTVAAAAMWGSNLFSGDRPEAEAKSNPLYGSFIAADVPRGREDIFYDLQERADRAMETYKDLQRKQHPKEAKAWFDENKDLIIASGFTTAAATSLKSVNSEIRRLSDLPAEKMSAEEKRKQINYYKNKKNDILEQTIKFRLKAGL